MLPVFLSVKQQQTFAQTAQQQQVQPQQQQQMAKPNFTQQSTTNTMAVKTGNQAAMAVTPAPSGVPSSTASPALPLSQLLLSSSAAPVILGAHLKCSYHYSGLHHWLSDPKS
ncbi:hypothetical protein E3U43_019737 [Larimichthys crocea]|uniref:Uncharacterized protein n=1 Tax=Larimichthys crocea TaxID=215358 RepID=A0ACD3QWA1_LARCR|nr:hypothetical protein E3U43_019737 [Larimichthys crocea]